jgi:hypothetical protein
VRKNRIQKNGKKPPPTKTNSKENRQNGKCCSWAVIITPRKRPRHTKPNLNLKTRKSITEYIITSFVVMGKYFLVLMNRKLQQTFPYVGAKYIVIKGEVLGLSILLSSLP